jgi:hypothetical protein
MSTVTAEPTAQPFAGAASKTALEWAAQSAAPRCRKKIRVMGERDIISATALFAFYDEVSHELVFHRFQKGGFAVAT